MIQSFNFVFDEMCHGTGSAANFDFDVEEQENIMSDFEYFRAEESDQFSFFRIPDVYKRQGKKRLQPLYRSS